MRSFRVLQDTKVLDRIFSVAKVTDSCAVEFRVHSNDFRPMMPHERRGAECIGTHGRGGGGGRGGEERRGGEGEGGGRATNAKDGSKSLARQRRERGRELEVRMKARRSSMELQQLRERKRDKVS